ncbi:pentapeptide repeat-containing protein [Paenibacillus sp. GCM10028914]|uniref:pentapeptide repeat-containing protein n=1 Tax=Paenibacillus sp. GCM10028914 TaxID=3273416 RepID=UPI0036061EB9
MNKQELLREFDEQKAAPLRHQMLLQIEEAYQRKGEVFAAEWAESFRRLCRNVGAIQRAGRKGPVSYITYSLLRTQLAAGRSVYRIEAADESWFLDSSPYRDTYDSAWAFDYLHQYRREIAEAARPYAGQIGAADLDCMLQREAAQVHAYIIGIGRLAMEEASASAEFAQLEMTEVFEVRVGEYLDVSEVVYKRDRTIKDTDAVRISLNRPERSNDYAYEDLRKLDLTELSGRESDLRYADLSGCELEAAVLAESVLLGTVFAGSCMKNADLSHSLIAEADFRGCDLRGTSFAGALGMKGRPEATIWTMPGYRAVDFRGANLEGADFRGAALNGALFTGARLEGADFTGADLQDAVFDRLPVER